MVVDAEKQSEWVLVYTRANQEVRAKKNLENQGFETFLPLIAKKQITQSHTVYLEAIFPRYVFTKINLQSDNWRPIGSTRGVSHLIYFGGKHAVVPSDLVALLKSKVDKDETFHPKIIKNEFRKGDKLIIKKGAFSSFEGIFMSTSSKERVRLLLRFLKQSVITEVSISDLDKKESLEKFKI